MSSDTWHGDAVGLVDPFRAGDRSPSEELEATFAAVDANDRLTFPANLRGNPAISLPAGFLDGLPIGLQIVGRHVSEPLLLDLAHTIERHRPWPLTSRG